MNCDFDNTLLMFLVLFLLSLSGDIQAYVNSEVLEQFPVELRRGSVILLKKVGVLKSGQARGIYLLITPNNLAVIYPPDEGKTFHSHPLYASL